MSKFESVAKTQFLLAQFMIYKSEEMIVEREL